MNVLPQIGKVGNEQDETGKNWLCDSGWGIICIFHLAVVYGE